MRKQIIVRVIKPVQKWYYLVPVSISQMVTFPLAPGYEFAIHRPVNVNAEDKTVVISSGWVVSELKSGLRVAGSDGARADAIKNTIAIFERAKEFYRNQDFIEISKNKALSMTRAYTERKLACP